MTGSQHWCTPLWLCNAAHEAFGRAPDLDPFSNGGSLTGARDHWLGPKAGGIDGFECSWAACAETVFFNPPWSRSGDAVRKAEAEWSDGAEIIGVLPCSMNSRYWPIVEAAPARCYLSKRPSFLENGTPKRGNPKDVAVVYWGRSRFRFAQVFEARGRCHFGNRVAA